MFPAVTLSFELIQEKELIHGNFQQGDELVKNIKAGMLAPVFHIHDGARGAIHKLSKVFLCPAFCLPDAYPDFQVYRAWTSPRIRTLIYERDHVKIDSVPEAMEQMAQDGIRDVIVQPTHMLNGIQNDGMKDDAMKFSGAFSSLRFGSPLLTSAEDGDAVLEAILSEFHDLFNEEMLVLMGHGTAHCANSVYGDLNRRFKDLGHPNIFLGTVDASPDIGELLALAAARRPRRILLAPFLIVSGSHVLEDMAGANQDSWRSRFSAAGYEVKCVLKGLGEYPAIRRIFLRHIAEAV